MLTHAGHRGGRGPRHVVRDLKWRERKMLCGRKNRQSNESHTAGLALAITDSKGPLCPLGRRLSSYIPYASQMRLELLGKGLAASCLVSLLPDCLGNFVLRFALGAFLPRGLPPVNVNRHLVLNSRWRKHSGRKQRPTTR